MRPFSFTVLTFLALTAPALAVSMVVSNASFEVPSLSPGQSTYAAGPLQFTPEQSLAIPGWGGVLGYAPQGTITVSAGVRNATNAVDGNQTLYIKAHAEISGQLGTIWQDVGEISPNTTYKLTVAAGGPLTGVAYGATGLIALMVNTWEGTPLAATNFTSVGSMQGLSDYVVTCKTEPSVSGRLIIALTLSALPGPYPYEVNFDNVRLEAFPPPTLTITALNDALNLAWPSWATNYWLDAAHELSPNATWLPITNTGALGTNQLMLPSLPDGSAFYRLRTQ